MSLWAVKSSLSLRVNSPRSGIYHFALALTSIFYGRCLDTECFSCSLAPTFLIDSAETIHCFCIDLFISLYPYIDLSWTPGDAFEEWREIFALDDVLLA